MIPAHLPPHPSPASPSTSVPSASPDNAVQSPSTSAHLAGETARSQHDSPSPTTRNVNMVPSTQGGNDLHRHAPLSSSSSTHDATMTDDTAISTISTTQDEPNTPRVVPLKPSSTSGDQLYYRAFRSEAEDLAGMMRLVEQELSEPYNVYTFRYFILEWPHLTFLVFPSPKSTEPIATIICKQESHKGKTNRGYIGMLSVDRAFRRRGIASTLVKLAIKEMASRGADEVVLETEFDNISSLALYDRLGFLREKRIQRFYSNFKDAFRLILPLAKSPPNPPETPDEQDRGRWLIGTGPEYSGEGAVHSKENEAMDVTQEMASVSVTGEDGSSEEGRYFPLSTHTRTEMGDMVTNVSMSKDEGGGRRRDDWEGMYT